MIYEIKFLQLLCKKEILYKIINKGGSSEQKLKCVRSGFNFPIQCEWNPNR